MDALQRGNLSDSCRTMVRRVRITARVRVRNFKKIQAQDLPSFLYANQRFSPCGNHALCFLVLEHPTISLEYLSSSLLRSLSLMQPSSSLDRLPTCEAMVPTSTALLC